ncbi:MAG TPA: L-seryl-tRNA(Sec) selenium transferase [Myxococcota bacterium]|nr:L-seryl-tRNA(Sec) selenium transferase [Myxococcota bacterium]
MADDVNEILRQLPAVDAVLSQADVAALFDQYPRSLVVEGVRRVLRNRRAILIRGESPDERPIAANDVAAAIADWNTPELRPVINATGVVIHTNLGRSPISRDAAAAVARVAAGYSNLEMNLDDGKRGSRMDVIREILLERSGAEDALVVNNNAAAVYLALRVLAAGREVVVSRGELVEIGGSFRIPDVMAASGAVLREVGTTNRTRLEDYRRAIGPQTALLLKVHRSNFEMVGFTEETPPDELARLAHENRIPMLVDMGWGTFLDSLPQDLGAYQTPGELLKMGVDLVCFSGDKLLGGPQCGILLGGRNLVRLLSSDPMARALRVGKLTLAALWQTLASYRDGDRGARSLPVLSMLLAEPRELEARARHLLAQINEACPDIAAEVIQVSGQVGGGAMPLVELGGFAVVLDPPSGDALEFAAALRAGDPPVLARLQKERVILDVRTMFEAEQLGLVAGAVRSAAEAGPVREPR